MSFNYKTVIHLLGVLLILNGIFMLLSLPFAFYYHEDILYIIISSGLSIISGGIVWLSTRRYANKELRKKDGYLIVTFGWILLSVSGSLPYITSGYIPDVTNAFFETISGYTTTGASVINNLDSFPRALLFWRSLTQWIGGMGIIVLAVAILPILGIGGMQLFIAESPGITPDKIKPRIREVAKRLWYMYLALTLLEMVLLMFAGMTFYDAINHSLTTMSSGGFSTRQESIGYYTSPVIQYIIIVFMFLAGTNFTITYFAIKGQLKKSWRNEEFRNYAILIIVSSLIISVFVFTVHWQGVEKSFRDSLFQVVSLITTTGFVSADYTKWSSFLTVIFFLFLFLGACAGSTSGGIKIVRYTLLVKNSFLEMKRQLHPSAIIPVRLNGVAVSRKITYNVLAFIMIYLLIFCGGVFAISFTGLDLPTALSAVATSLGNVGPGIGKVGPAYTFSEISDFGKWLLTFLMLLGRLELFTVLMLFSSSFWKKY